MGGAAAGASVLGLDTEQTRMALGIAASRTGGLTANTGTMVKSTHPGNASRMGAEAAILARSGFTSNPDVLEARYGYADALFRGEMEWDTVTGGLGDSYRIVDPGFDIKRFPAQITMQRPIESVLNLRQTYGFSPDDVEQLTVEVRGQGHSGPIPTSGLDGKFSIEYCAAAALLDGDVNIETFTDQRRFSPDMEAMLPRVSVSPRDSDSARATAQLRNGRTVSEECLHFRGSAANPMSREERVNATRNRIFEPYEYSQQEFLAFVLDHYVQQGVDELAEAKLPHLLELKYHAMADAVAALGDPGKIRELFIGFQQHLCTPQGVA